MDSLPAEVGRLRDLVILSPEHEIKLFTPLWCGVVWLLMREQTVNVPRETPTQNGKALIQYAHRVALAALP